MEQDRDDKAATVAAAAAQITATAGVRTPSSAARNRPPTPS
jgi:hypothetical protein